MKTAIATLLAVAAIAFAVSPVHADDTGAILIEVPDMVCEGCASSVTKALKKLEGVTDAHVDPVKKVALISASSKPALTDESIKAAVDEAGYEAKKIQRLDATFAKAKADLEKQAG